MASKAADPQSILIVEDDYFIANDLVSGFADAGFRAVGPVGSLSKARGIIETEKVAGAILDINLDDEKVYELADTLIGRGVPVVFVTGYERPSIPDQYRDVQLCLKPVESGKVIAALRLAGGL